MTTPESVPTRATVSEEEMAKARDIVCGKGRATYLSSATGCDGCGICPLTERRRAVWECAQALADAKAAERERQETQLTYCPTHRTIVPAFKAFKDHRLSCCVLADEREKWWKVGWSRAMHLAYCAVRFSCTSAALDDLNGIPIEPLPTPDQGEKP